MRLGHAFGPWPMRPPPAARESFAAAIALIAARVTIDLRLGAGDERRQPIDAASVGDHGLRLRLILRLVALLAVMFARLMLFARLIGLLMVPLVVVARHVGLLLRRHES